MVSTDHLFANLIEYFFDGDATDLIVSASRDEDGARLFLDATNADGSRSHRSYTEEAPRGADDAAQE